MPTTFSNLPTVANRAHHLPTVANRAHRQTESTHEQQTRAAKLQAFVAETRVAHEGKGAELARARRAAAGALPTGFVTHLNPYPPKSLPT